MLAGLLAVPAPALGSNVSVVDGQLRYEAGAGQVNSASIMLVDGNTYRVNENDATAKDRAPLTTGPGCAGNGNQVDCPGAGVTSVSVSLGDRDDSFRARSLPVPMGVSGGAGADDFAYSLYPDSVALTITADGRPDDGPAGRDNVATDVETLIGDSFADTLANGPGGGRLVGRLGDDRLTAGAGADVIQAAYVEDVGLESGTFYPEGTDTVKCGGGKDMVFADGTDRIDADCEIVGRKTPGGFRFTGSHGPDRISPPYGWGPVALYGRGGGDLLIANAFAGPANVYGGTGNDRIQGAEYYADGLEGGSGNDRIRAREGKKPVKDTVKCGPGFDTAIVDRLDRVSGCERVLRSR